MAISYTEKVAATALANPAGSNLLLYEAACKAVATAKNADEAIKLVSNGETLRLLGKAAKNRQIEIDGAEIRIRAERRLGQIMDSQRKAGLLSEGGRPPETGSRADPVTQAALKETGKVSPPDAKITLAEAGIDKHLADRARKGATMTETTFEEKLGANRSQAEAGGHVTVSLDVKKVRSTSGHSKDEWHTPDEVMTSVRNVLGLIDLDPASSHAANLTIRATNFCDQDQDRFSKPWAGNVYLCIPAAGPSIARLAEKLASEWEEGHITSAIMLTENFTDNTWFHRLAHASTAMCFTKGRIRFVSPAGKRASPRQGHIFFYFGARGDKFGDIFGEIGIVLGRI